MRAPASAADMIAEIRSLAGRLETAEDLNHVVAAARESKIVCIGEASHGTHEFYAWRATLSKRLIEEEGFTWIGVEGDWPDCSRINRWVRGFDEQELSAYEVLSRFERWPTWMWANQEVCEFVDWLHDFNMQRAASERVGFYGLDVYSLWDSLRVIIEWLTAHKPDALPAALEAWRCFDPFDEYPQKYAWGTRMIPHDCEDEVIDLLIELGRNHIVSGDDSEALFDARQNAEVAAAAEHYYRTMVRGDQESWNVRDVHMADTIDRISAHLGPLAKGIVWEHNTHVGDARATTMAAEGMVNVGQLMRERHHTEGVTLIGFASYTGGVMAASAWGSVEQRFATPDARPGSHEELLHHALGANAALVFGENRMGPWLSAVAGHRAIGVVYAPERERGNYVPTVMGGRYDALLWFERADALTPLHHEPKPDEPEFETEPSGF